VAPHKTIIGTGDGASLKGGFQLGSNVILRNFKVSGGVDGVQVSRNSSIWVDHCDLSACGDGLLDITNGSDKITVSWTRFSDHHKTMLINNGGGNRNDDKDRNNVTLHHLWWDGSNTRNPRAGYGQIHVLNCYYYSNGYGLHVYWNVRVRVERNYFEGLKDAISDHYRNQKQGDWPGPGYVVLIDNYTDTPGSIMKETTTDPDRIFDVESYYLYDWVVTRDVQKVPEVVKQGAGTGAQWAKIGAIPTPGQGYTRVSTNPTLKWTKVGSQASNKVYFGKSYPPPEVATVDGHSYQPGKLNEGTVYYWKINNGKVWKFRTEGTPDPARLKPALKSRKTVSKFVTLQKGPSSKGKVLLGVQKGDKEKRVYDLNGRSHTLSKRQPNKDISRLPEKE
jgi:pectate lyase